MKLFYYLSILSIILFAVKNMVEATTQNGCGISYAGLVSRDCEPTNSTTTVTIIPDSLPYFITFEEVNQTNNLSYMR